MAVVLQVLEYEKAFFTVLSGAYACIHIPLAPESPYMILRNSRSPVRNNFSV